ncbi:MAG: NUDIX domain-containing protein [bacterium]|nr:NUDIX domain-containing protein [bacterium]
MDEKRPKVGIGVMIFKDGKVLLGKRKSSHGAEEYAWPGGHLEYMESVEECAKREVLEETGMKIKNVKFLRLLNFKDYAPKHYIDIGVTADWKSGEPKVREPEKCESWSWYKLQNLPVPLFKALPSYFEALKTGKNFFDN